MLKAMITAACMVALMIGAAAAATPEANWPYQANQRIRPAAAVIVNADTSPGSIKISDGTNTAKVDYSGFLVTIEAAHSRVHRGFEWTISDSSSIATAGESSTLMIVTGDTTVHAVFSVGANLGGIAILTEGCSYSAIGTMLYASNFNRAHQGDTYGARIYDNPTLSSYGTLMQQVNVGGGSPAARVGGQSRESTEWVLDPNTLYLLRFIADSNATRVVKDFSFYEANL